MTNTKLLLRITVLLLALAATNGQQPCPVGKWACAGGNPDVDPDPCPSRKEGHPLKAGQRQAGAPDWPGFVNGCNACPIGKTTIDVHDRSTGATSESECVDNVKTCSGNTCRTPGKKCHQKGAILGGRNLGRRQGSYGPWCLQRFAQIKDPTTGIWRKQSPEEKVKLLESLMGKTAICAYWHVGGYYTDVGNAGNSERDQYAIFCEEDDVDKVIDVSRGAVRGKGLKGRCDACFEDNQQSRTTGPYYLHAGGGASSIHGPFTDTDGNKIDQYPDWDKDTDTYVGEDTNGGYMVTYEPVPTFQAMWDGDTEVDTGDDYMIQASDEGRTITLQHTSGSCD